jgi:nicotinamidase/pyrazinamidase
MQITALLIVDVQYDFLPGGSLGVEDGDAIIWPLLKAARDCDLVIASRDWHPANHFSFEGNSPEGRWPPHCVQNTQGAKLERQIRKIANYVVSKGMSPHPPDDFSAFRGQTLRPVHKLEEILQRHAIQRLIIGGLAYDYCVRWTAHDAAALKYEPIVPLNCTRAISKEGVEHTTEALERSGVRIVDHWSL